MVKKANGKWRMCIDYTDLNSACPKDPYPFPNIDQLIDATSGHVMLSFMDAYSGNNQIKMNPKDILKTSFITHRMNSEADTLSKLVQNSSDLDCSVYFEELQRPSIESEEVMEIDNNPNWTTPFINYLEKGELPEDKGKAQRLKAKATNFFIEKGILYRQTFSSPILKCIGPGEAQYCLMEVHEGICRDHMSAKALAHKIIRQGYYWPTIHQDAIDFVKNAKNPKSSAM
ncbi:uncharacterized protein LOC141690815 [Apium graveolens]|uniref:uncharacterized protein LOC141690815 n=1 Tax=Apium graveolens TaxID=4045 RepID=UPI003D79A17C